MIQIRRTFLIARQEFIKYVTRRGFLISLLMLPLIMLLSIAVPSFTASHPRANVMTVVDLAGGYSDAIAAAAARDQVHSELSALAEYAKAHADWKALRRQDKQLAQLFETPDRIASIKAFVARGGWQPAFAELKLKPGAPVFDPPQPPIVLVPPPADLAEDVAAGRTGSIMTYLSGALSVTARGRPSRLTAVVVIPKAYAPDSAREAQYWSMDSEQSVSFVRGALTDAFRLKLNQALVAPELRAKVTLDVDAPLKTIDPAKGHEVSWKDKIADVVPIGLAFLLFIIAFSDAALLLQSVVEEKSTRMVEVLLSCASPHEIMTGKLLGVTALALVTMTAWASMGFIFAVSFSPEVLPVIQAGLAGIVPLLPLVVFYFFCGLLIYSSIFLGIGATSNSLPDAQALIGPATMVIMLPNLLLGALIQDPNGLLAQIISWIPIYTPFFMLVRLPFHPAPFEIWATGLLTLVTTGLLIRQMGRVFARHILTSERPPSFAALLRQVFVPTKVG